MFATLRDSLCRSAAPLRVCDDATRSLRAVLAGACDRLVVLAVLLADFSALALLLVPARFSAVFRFFDTLRFLVAAWLARSSFFAAVLSAAFGW